MLSGKQQPVEIADIARAHSDYQIPRQDVFLYVACDLREAVKADSAGNAAGDVLRADPEGVLLSGGEDGGEDDLVGGGKGGGKIGEQARRAGIGMGLEDAEKSAPAIPLAPSKVAEISVGWWA